MNSPDSACHSGRPRFNLTELATAFDTAQVLDYEQTENAGVLEKRLIEQVRTLYRRDNLTSPLPPGELQSLALPYESYQLAFTPGLVADLFGGRVDESMLQEGGYVWLSGPDGWWIPSGQIYFTDKDGDPPPQELTLAQAHFYLPRRYVDPFGASTTVRYDDYDLLLVETRDAIGNRVTVGERALNGDLAKQGNDYRMLQPRLMMDANRNRAEVSFDILGLVSGTAVMGKPEESLGDSLTGFQPDLTQKEIDAFIADPTGKAGALLGDATTAHRL